MNTNVRIVISLLLCIATASVKAQVEKTVALTEAGTLSNYISEDEKYNIIKLTVTGPINGKDFVLLRDMGGCSDVNSHTEGMLEELDLSDAQIVASNDVYFSYAGRSYTSADDMLGPYTFLYCDKLHFITLPSHLKEIGDQAFSGCEMLEDVKIPEEVTTIGVGAFLMCNSITKIEVPDAVTTLKTGAFQRMALLNEITFGAGVTELENSIFMYDDRLSIVRLGRNTETFNTVIFYQLGSLKEIDVPAENPFYTSIDGVLFDKQLKKLILFPSAKEAEEYEVPSTVEKIGNNAFTGVFRVSTVTVPSSVVELEEEAFSANSIRSFNLSEGLQTVGAYAFASLDLCPSITFPASVSFIDPTAFYLSSSLTNIYVADGNELYTSHEGVLYDKNISTLVYYPTARPEETFTCPESVENIGDMAFLASYNLREIQLDHIKNVGEFAFYYGQALASVSLGEEMEHIGYCAFADCEHLNEVYCHVQQLTDVDPEAFANENLSTEGTLYVPAGTKDFYATQPWVFNTNYGMSFFANIEEMQTEDMKGLVAPGQEGPAEYFTPDGRRVSAPPSSGIYIIKRQGKTVKVAK